MSETDSHWREPPEERINPEYPIGLTDRYEDMDYEGTTVIYDRENRDAYVCGFGLNSEDML